MILAASAVLVALWDFDVSDGGLVPGTGGQWQWGTPATGPGPASKAWATRIGGFYLNDAVDTLEVPLPDLSGAARPVVVIEHWWDVRLGDAGWLEVDDGAGFARVEPIYGYPDPAGFTGSSGGWRATYVDLSAFGPDPRLRFVFAADVVQAAAGWYLGAVSVYDGDVAPPQLAPVLLPVDTQDLVGPYVVELDLVDDVGVDDAQVVWSVDGGAAQVSAMTRVSTTRWRALLPGQAPDSVVRWSAVAFDTAQSARWPATGEASFRVFLAAPTGLVAPEGRVVGPAVPLSWTPPVSPHAVLGYEVDVDGQPYVVDTASADVPVVDSGAHAFSVSAVYAAGVGDASAPVTVDVEVPSLLSLSPASAFQADRVYVDLVGTSLYLHEVTADLALGDGVTVETLDVVDASHAVAVVRVRAQAEPGPRDAVVTGSFGTYTFPDAFTVLDGADRPRILSVEPDAITQGDTMTVRVLANEPFAAPPAVDAGPGLLVVSDVVSDGTIATFDLLALGTAGPGERLLVLDDGTRLWGAPFEVREYVVPLERGCNHAGPGSWWLLPLVFLTWRSGARARSRRWEGTGTG